MTNHLWQSTLFAVAAGLLTLAFRKNRAQVRYWLWLSASLKFLMPLGVLIGLGGHVPAKRVAAPAVSIAIERLAEPFSAPPEPSPPGPRDWVPVAILVVWASGFAAIALIRLQGWLSIVAAVRASSRLDIAAPVEVRSSPALLEPGVVGFLRPALLVPAGILESLTPPQLDAVLAHELCHIRRRDNLTSAIHMVVEAVFWFHPLVWWIGARLVEERERACDEEVLRLGGEPRVYAEAILTVCKLYVEPPLKCMSGVTGSDLKMRIEAILGNRVCMRLNLAKKICLTLTAIAVLATPIAIGMIKAQSAVRPKFEVASIKPCQGGDAGFTKSGAGPSPGRLHMDCNTVAGLIDWAYVRFADGRHFSFARSGPPFKGGPAWIDSETYEIDAKPESPQATGTMNGPMLQALLEERFKLKLHRETREVPVYVLTVARSGFRKLPVAPDGSCVPVDEEHRPEPQSKPCGFFRPSAKGDGIDSHGQTMTGLCLQFSSRLDRDVIDATGIRGMFDIHLEMSVNDLFPRGESNEAADPSSVFAAVQSAVKKLGLRLEPSKRPEQFLVIDHIERPTAN